MNSIFILMVPGFSRSVMLGAFGTAEAAHEYMKQYCTLYMYSLVYDIPLNRRVFAAPGRSDEEIVNDFPGADIFDKSSKPDCYTIPGNNDVLAYFHSYEVKEIPLLG